MRLLYVVKNLRVSNGVSSYVMNYFRDFISEQKDMKIDFLVISDIPTPYYEEIESNGGKVFVLPSIKKNVFKVCIYLNKLFKNNHYDIVHCNEMNTGAFVQKYAKKYNVPVRILHCHTSINGDTIIKKIIYNLFLRVTIHYSNILFACSNYAGKSIFKKKKFTVINNAIDIKKFKYNENIRNEIRKENNVENKYIIIVVGRITQVKNPYFILKIAKQLNNINDNFELWWFGNGNMDEEIKEKVHEDKMEGYIKLFGAVNNVNDYYSAADLFILPSLWEGLPVVGIEAQISGLNCIFSNTITDEVKISDGSIFLPIDDSTVWVNEILKLINNNSRNTIKDIKKYGIEYQAAELNKLYNKLLENNKK